MQSLFHYYHFYLQVTITLFREDEYGQIGETGFSAQRSYTGPVSHNCAIIICTFNREILDKKI